MWEASGLAERGSPHPELREGPRTIPSGKAVIAYLVHGQVIDIVRIRYGGQIRRPEDVADSATPPPFEARDKRLLRNAHRAIFPHYRHPELVSGPSWSPVREVEDWMLKQVQHDGEGPTPHPSSTPR